MSFHKSTPLAAIAALLLVSCATTKDSDLKNPMHSMSAEEIGRKMAEAGTPGAAHKRLEPLVGKFTAKMSCWMDPSAPAEVSNATETSEWIFDGRFVQSKFEGSMQGQPFHGIGLAGYDNTTKQYQMSWVDSMSTMMMPIAVGTLDSSGKVFTYSTDWTCPIQGKIHTRFVMTVIDNNRHNLEMFNTAGDGIENRGMLIEYTRAK